MAAARGAHTVAEAGFGLNPALEQVSDMVDPVAPLLALSADLPLLKAADLDAMAAELTRAEVVAASDRAGSGTNALLLRCPGLIAYAFGENSLARHREAALAAGRSFQVFPCDNMAADIDLPEDLEIYQN